MGAGAVEHVVTVAGTVEVVAENHYLGLDGGKRKCGLKDIAYEGF
jgi:hypothetical protein